MENKGCIATIGMFDGVHRGHRFLLDKLKHEATLRGLTPIVVTFNRHPKNILTGSDEALLLTDSDEKQILINQEGIDTIISLDFNDKIMKMSAGEFMHFLKYNYSVDALLMGYDHHFGHDRLKKKEDYVNTGIKDGIEVIMSEELPGGVSISSSKIRKALSEGDIKTVTALLGRRYSITGKVEAGKKIGRTIGFPTANIRPKEKHQMMPANGVYVVRIKLENGRTFYGMLNIGVRPTVDHSKKTLPSLEVNIFDYEGNLYNSLITIELIDRLRDEHKYDSLENLRKQLLVDKTTALKLIADYAAAKIEC